MAETGTILPIFKKKIDYPQPITHTPTVITKLIYKLQVLIFKIQLTGREWWKRRTENGG